MAIGRDVPSACSSACPFGRAEAGARVPAGAGLVGAVVADGDVAEPCRPAEPAYSVGLRRPSGVPRSG